MHHGGNNSLWSHISGLIFDFTFASPPTLSIKETLYVFIATFWTGENHKRSGRGRISIGLFPVRVITSSTSVRGNESTTDRDGNRDRKSPTEKVTSSYLGINNTIAAAEVKL